MAAREYPYVVGVWHQQKWGDLENVKFRAVRVADDRFVYERRLMDALGNETWVGVHYGLDAPQTDTKLNKYSINVFELLRQLDDIIQGRLEE